jgi:hypothetical protein
LFGNISRIENGLEIHPLALAFGPFLKNITHYFKLVVPDDDPFFKGLLERTELHRLGVDDMLVQDLLDIVVVLYQEG